MKVLLSIKPIYANKILNGEKFFELRKSIPKKEFDVIIIYSSFPEKKIIWEFKVDKIICKNLDELWDITKEWSCVDRNFFDEYFKWKTKWYAIRVSNPIRYKETFPITKYCKTAPQSFMYLN